MSSQLTTTVNIISAAIYTMVRPTGSVIDANPTATTIGLGCPSHKKIECNQNYTNILVVGPWASTVVPEGLPSTGTFRWYWEVEKETLSYECLMSSGIRKTCTGRYIQLRDTESGWTRESWTVTKTEDMFDTILLPIVLTSGLERLGTDVQATSTEDVSKISASNRKAATETLAPVTPTLFIYDAEEYMIQTPTGSVFSPNPTATTIELGCPVQSACPFEYSNTFVVGPWASKTVPAGAASTGVFHWMLALNDLGGTSSVECLVKSGTPQICTTMALPKETGEDGITDVATGFGSITKEFELMFGTLPIVITKGQELLERATQATTTEDSSAAQATGSKTRATNAEVAATDASSDAAAPKETNGAGSSAVRMLVVLFMAGLASFIVQF